jgi:hypothetical protein
MKIPSGMSIEKLVLEHFRELCGRKRPMVDLFRSLLRE